MTTQEVFKNLGKEDALNFINSDKTDKKTYDFLVSKGLTDSFEEYSAIIEKLDKLSSGEEELSDDELEKVAGGWLGQYTSYEIEAMYNDYVKNWQPQVTYYNGLPMIFDTEPMPYDLWLLNTGNGM